MTPARLRLLANRVGAARRRCGGGAVPCDGGPGDSGGQDVEGGFVLLEEIVSISILIIVMAALATFFLGATQSTSYQRAKQSAIQLSNTEMDAVRAAAPQNLVLGRSTNVNSTQRSAPAAVAAQAALASMTAATESTTTVLTLAPTIPATANKISYTVNNYLGYCYLSTDPATHLSTCTTATGGTPGTRYLRAVVATTWAGVHCPNSLCAYVTSSLISPDPDPLFSLQAAGPPSPTVSSPGDQFSTVGSALPQPGANGLQLTVTDPNSVAPFTWTTTTLPAGLSMSTSGLITGAPTTAAAATAITVVATDSFGRQSPPLSYNWTVYAAPTVAGLTTPFTTSPGATVTAQSLAYTCPASSCTIALAGAPAGIGLATTSNGTGSTTPLSVTTASGTIYLNGTVSTSAAGPYPVSVTITDTASKVAGTPNTVTWTVAVPTVTGLGAKLTTAVGATPAAQTLSYSCPTANCTYTLTGAPTGIGLSATSTGAASTSPITVNTASGSLYLVGTVGTGVTPGTFTLTITPADAATGRNGTAMSSTWTVLAVPTVTGMTATLSTTPGATIANQTLSYTCPSTSCTYTLAGAPGGIGLAKDVTTTPAASLSVTGTSGTFLLAGTVATTATGNYTLVVSSLDTTYGEAGTSNTAAWKVRPPTVTGLTDPFSTTVGATIAAQTLTYTCPTSNCAYNLTGAPTGIGLSTTTTATGTPPTSLSVKNASGTLYLVGTVTAPATSSYSLVLTPVDTNSGASAVTNTATWTVYPVPTVTGLAAFKTTVGAAVSAQTLNYTCPSGACTFAVSNGPAGVGLSLSATGTAGSSVQPPSGTSGMIYLVGTPTAAGSGILSVTPVDTASQGSGTANTAAFTVYAAPTVTGSTAAFRTPVNKAITGQPLSYTCPTSTCTYTVTGAPTGIGLATSASATGTPPTSLAVTNANGTLYLVGSPSPAGSYTVVVTAKDTTYGVTGSSVTAAWTVFAPPTVTGLTALRTTAGATITAQQLTYSCPTSTCTLTLSGAPTGIGLSTSSGATGTQPTSLAVTATSGSVYVVGSPSPAGSYPSVTVTPVDTTYAVTGTATTAAWTIYAPPTVSGLTNPFSTSVGATIASQTLPFTCPSGSCTEALTGAPGGVGLDTDNVGAVTSSVPVTGTSGNVYLRGTVTGPVSGPSSYVNDVKNQGATNFWRLNEANGTTVGADSIGSLPLTEQSGVTNGATGATLSASGGTSTYDGAATFNGVSTTGSASTRTAIAAPTVFSESIWFKTTTTTGGKLFGFGSSATGNSGQYDRQIYMTNSGQLVFGVYNGGTQVITSSAAYNDGAWHEAVATISGAGMTFLVDGVSVGTNTNTAAEGNNSGYWRIGGDNLGNWPSASTSYYFAGVLDDAAVYSGVALTAAQAQKQYVDAQGVLYTATVTPTDTPSGVSGVPNTATWTVFAGPTAAGLPATFTVTAGATVANQPISYTCPTTTCTFALAGAPSGIGLSTATTGTTTTPVTVTASSGTIYLRGTAGAAGNYSVSVTPTETTSGAVGTATTSAWTVNYPPPTVTDSVSTFTVTAGTTVANQSLPFTCPSANCTFTLTGYPAGIGLSTATTGTPTTTPINVTGSTSGTLYLRGTVALGAGGSYPAVNVTPVDNTSNQTGTVATASWTVNSPPPTVTGLTQNFRTTVGAVVANQSLSYTCPSTNCTYTLAGAPTGIGLSTTTTGAVTNQVTVPTTATSGTIYLRGTVGTSVTPGTFNLVVTPKDNGTGLTGTTNTATWTVYAQPTTSGLPANFGTIPYNSAQSVTITYTCPTSNCTYTLANAPTGFGLSAASSGGSLPATLTVSDTGGTFYVRGTATAKGTYNNVTLTPTDNVSMTNGPVATSSGTVQ